MLVTIVDVYVKPEYIDAFIEASTKNHLAPITEDGNCRFDLLQSNDDPNHFILYEAYCTEQQAKAHKETSHYLSWRETVAEMMAEPRKGTAYNALQPLCKK